MMSAILQFSEPGSIWGLIVFITLYPCSYPSMITLRHNRTRKVERSGSFWVRVYILLGHCFAFFCANFPGAQMRFGTMFSFHQSLMMRSFDTGGMRNVPN